jgi:hypothetical protein
MADDRTEAAILWRIDPWIFREEGLSFMEKMLLNYVFSWSIQGRCCFSSDQWLAYKLNVEVSDIFTTLNLLEMKGYIKINRAFEGGARSLSFTFSDVKDVCEGSTGPEDIFQID